MANWSKLVQTKHANPEPTRTRTNQTALTPFATDHDVLAEGLRCNKTRRDRQLGI